MKDSLKRLVGRSIWARLRALLKKRRADLELDALYRYDRALYGDFASPRRDFKREENRLAFAVMLYHSLEKGMALKSPRAGFGREKAETLLAQLELVSPDGQADSRFGAGLEAMRSWLEWNAEREVDFSSLQERVRALESRDALDANDWRTGGVSQLTRQELQTKVSASAKSFMTSRHSIRQFSDKAVDSELIRAAVRLAQTSPSLCNRQSCHVHVFSKGERAKQLLDLQGGNRGFAEQVDKVFVVTSELGCFLSAEERNQCWVEGGLFAMALLYGLHAQGLGACCLNWAKEEEEDRQLHALADIPQDQRVIMLIAVGNLPEEFTITHSPRRSLNEIMHFVTIDET